LIGLNLICITERNTAEWTVQHRLLGKYVVGFPRDRTLVPFCFYYT
jgi:hypothetical protein